MTRFVVRGEYVPSLELTLKLANAVYLLDQDWLIVEHDVAGARVTTKIPRECIASLVEHRMEKAS